MYIKSMYVRNFRNFAEATFTFKPGLTVLVGENGAGKSNAIHALRLVFDSSLNKQARTLDEADFHFSDSVLGGREVLIAAVIAGFESTTKDLAYCARWKVATDEALVVYRFRPNEDVRQEVQDARQAATEAGILEGEEGWPAARQYSLSEFEYERSGGLQPKPLATVSIFDDFPRGAEAELNKYVVLELPAVRDVVRDMALRRQSPLIKLIELAASPTNVKQNVETIIATANASIRSDPFFLDIETRIAKSYEDLAAVPENLNVHVGLGDPSFSAALGSISLLLTDSALTDAEMSRNGLGFNNLLYIAILAEYFARRKVGQPSNQLLIVEEPEAHLHPNAQAALMKRLDENDHQTIVTTHSPAAVGAVGIKPLVAVTSGSSGSVARGVKEHAKLSVREENDLNRYLDANRSALLFARTVVFVEGITEEWLMRAVAAQRGLKLTKQNIALIPIAGTFFGVFEKLFASGVFEAECHIIADQDAQNSKGWLQARVPENGDLIARSGAAANVHWYQCRTTLEMALAQPENAQWISDAFAKIGYPVIARSVMANLQSGNSKLIQLAQLSTLRNAKRASKGRFVQVLAESIDSMVLLPPYLEAAFARLKK